MAKLIATFNRKNFIELDKAGIGYIISNGESDKISSIVKQAYQERFAVDEKLTPDFILEQAPLKRILGSKYISIYNCESLYAHYYYGELAFYVTYEDDFFSTIFIKV